MKNTKQPNARHQNRLFRGGQEPGMITENKKLTVVTALLFCGLALNSFGQGQDKVEKQFEVSISPNGATYGIASDKLLSSNLEVYGDQIPSMLSNRLRNSKFSGPENPQTGLAPEWDPVPSWMNGFSCKLVPGEYMSGREAQSIRSFSAKGKATISQHGVEVREGEEFEVEMWARARHEPVTVTVSLALDDKKPTQFSQGKMVFDMAHWVKRTVRIKAPHKGGTAFFNISIPAGTNLIIDQVHMRPVGEPNVSPALMDVFKDINCPTLRFPGGCVSTTYHWEHGIGPVHLRPICDDPVFKYKINYDFGTDEYLELCVATGMIPFITLNTTTATPDDAAAWAAYIRNYYVSRQLPVPAAYFAYGNENGSPHSLGHMTGEMYAASLRAFVPGVRKAYPEAKMIIKAARGGSSLRGKDPENPSNGWATVREDCADLYDVLATSGYTYGADLAFDKCMLAVAQNVGRRSYAVLRLAKELREEGLGKTIDIYEWRYFTRARHNDQKGFYEPNDIRHCLYSAGYLNGLCRLGETLEVANQYSLINTMGIFHMKDGQVKESDVVKVFKLFAPALPGEVLELDVDAPGFPSSKNNKKVDANFIRKGDTLYGFLINFSPDETARVSLSKLGKITEATGFKADAILTPVTEINPEFKDGFITLPPASMVRVICKD